MLALSCAAEPKKPIEMVPIGTFSGYVPKAPSPDQAETSPNAGSPQPTDARAGTAKDECLGSQFDNLEKAFAKRDCDAAPDADAEMKGKLSIKALADSPTVAPGGHVRITVSLTNDSQDKVPVFFRLDPTAHFEVSATDSKGKPADAIAGKKPSSGKEPESRTARVTLIPGGVIRVTTVWEAVKRKWASRNGKAFAVPAGALPKGKYSLRIVPPLVGVRDMGEFQPQVDITVGR